MSFFSFELSIATISYENLDFSLVGTWVGAIATVFAVGWGIYVHKKNNKSSHGEGDVVKNSENVINALNTGEGNVSIKAKQKIKSNKK